MADDSSGDSDSSLWTFVQRAGTIVVALGAVATVVLVYFELQDETPAASMQVFSVERLTPSLEAPNLNSRFFHRGEEVEDLWVARVRLANTGDVTLINQGPQKNTLGDGISFSFPSRLQLLEVVPDSSHVPISATVGDNGSLDVTFRQWRPGEAAQYSLYLNSIDPLDRLPLPEAASRNIIDGTVSVERVALTERSPRSVLRSLPDPLPAIGSFLGAIVVVVLVFFFFAVLVLANGVEHLRFWWWRNRHGDDFKAFLEAMDEPHFQDLQGASLSKDDLVESPWRANNDVWAEFTGRAFPFNPSFVSTRSPGTAAIFGLVITAGLVLLTLDAIPS